MKRLGQVFGTENDGFVANLEGDLIDEIIPAIVAKLDGLVMAVRINQKETEYEGEKRIQNNITAYHTMDAFGDDEDDD